MDSAARIISNLTNVVGCSGLRSLADLGRMKLSTIQGRVRDVEKKLPILSVISIFIAWLQAKSMQVGLDALPLEEWCRHLVHAYSCSESEILWYWDCSEWALWRYLSTTTSMLPDVRRHMGGVCREIRDVFARDGHGSVSVRDDDQRQAQTRCGASSWRPSDDPRRGPRRDASRGDRPGGDDLRGPTPKSEPGEARPSRDSAVLRTGDRRDMSAGRLADKKNCDSRSASSARRPSVDTEFACPEGNGNNPGRAMSHCPADEKPPRNCIPPDRYICNLCGTWGTHYVWDCTERISDRYQATVNSEMLPADAGRKDDKKTQGTHETPVKPERSGRLSAETPRSNHVVASQDRLQKQGIRENASPQKPAQEIESAFRPSSAPGVSRVPNRLNSNDLAQWPLSHETKHIKSPEREMHAQDTARDKRDEYQVNAQAVAEELKELSAADEVALQCADDFLCRLERALKRKYHHEVEHDLMFWDDETPRKKPRIEAATDHFGDGDGNGEVGHVRFFDPPTNAEADANANVDAATIPCPASLTTTRSSEPEESRSAREGKLSDMFCHQMANKPHVQNLLPGLSWGPTAQEPSHSAFELWQAGIDFKAAETLEDDR
ncbi:hypothetical protein E4U42_007997 [Claviceps africana]|uniref:Zinc knuckle CX2CX3GHX4C domain-containing protein n=1 Tax=Claviceps africana TaxID=83212 RepID=A0A8K0JB61_9HYPO|nr:hypothetical protein E4U42_007997 [Claviceps africana]